MAKSVAGSPVVPPYQRAAQVPTRNFFALLHADNMETENGQPEPKPAYQSGWQGQQSPSTKACRPLHIVLTSTLNLISSQRDLKQAGKRPFEFRNMIVGTKVMSEDIAD
jgi:hypothetical protein